MKNSIIFSRKIIVATIGLILLFSMSLSAFAEGSIAGLLPLSPPIAIKGEKEAFGLDMSKALIRPALPSKNRQQQEIIKLCGENIEKDIAFHPGDIILIPVSKGNYTENGFEPSKDFYMGKGVPSNWKILANWQDDTIDEVKWYISQDSQTASALYVMVSLKKAFAGTEKLPVFCEIALQDTIDKVTSNFVCISGEFENIAREASTTATNQIISPMTLTTNSLYKGEKLILSFGDGVVFKNAVMSHGQAMYLNLDCSFDNDVANNMKRFDLRFYNFVGDSDKFVEPGILSVPANSQESCAYEIIKGAPKRIPAVYNEETSTLTITTNTLNYYVITNS